MTGTLSCWIALRQGEMRELRGGEEDPLNPEAGTIRMYAWISAHLFQLIVSPRPPSDYAYCKIGFS